VFTTGATCLSSHLVKSLKELSQTLPLCVMSVTQPDLSLGLSSCPSLPSRDPKPHHTFGDLGNPSAFWVAHLASTLVESHQWPHPGEAMSMCVKAMLLQ
jgi:hypothetical protein